MVWSDVLGWRLVRIASTALIVLCALGASGAAGTPPGANGRIVFERLALTDSSGGALVVINGDGSHQYRLTHPPTGTEDKAPDWSPDGKRIAFERAPAS